MHVRYALLLALLVGFSGCGGSEDPTVSKFQPAKGEKQEKPEVVQPSNDSEKSPVTGVGYNEVVSIADTTPEVTVKSYLDALRDENIFVATNLLSKVAKKEFEKAKIVPSLPAPANANYQIGATQFVTDRKDRASVTSTWTESDTEGKTQTYAIDWFVKKEEESEGKWRVIGMMLPVGDEIVNFNFEDSRALAQHLESGSEETQTATAPQETKIR